MRKTNKPGVQMLLLTLVFALFGMRTSAQQKEKYNVAIFLYEGVELLDFAGPGEAFAATPGFTVYTMSVDGKDLVSQQFVTVKPQYSMQNAPVPDIVVFPGGNTGATSKNQQVLNWIKTRHAEGTTIMSICNGAGILASTGLLNGLTITSHHGFIAALRTIVPGSTVLENTKYVDNGSIITTAGVSAGIDGALHMISRIKGIDIAEQVAFYMEYDKWKPEEGRVEYKNKWIEKMQDESADAGRESNTISKNVNATEQVPYEGEVKNIGAVLLNKGLYQEAANAMEQGIKWYPNSAFLYGILSKADGKLGKPAPEDETAFIGSIEAGKIDEAISVYEKVQKNYPGWKIFSEAPLNVVGYRFMQKQDYTTAIKVFLLNAKAYPQSWNVWDSLAEAYLKAGNNKEAITNYKKSLELNPKNNNAKVYLTQLQG